MRLLVIPFTQPNPQRASSTAASICPASFSSTPCPVGCEDKPDDRLHRWLVVDGPPASCTQLGLFHAGFAPVRMTTTARGQWVTGGLFSPAAADPEKAALGREYRFRWAPQLADVKKQAEESPEGEDLWASVNGVIGIAPLKASFTAVDVSK